MPFRPFSFLLVRDAIVLAQPDRTAVRAPGGSVGLVRVREALLSLLCSVDSLPESSTPLRHLHRFQGKGALAFLLFLHSLPYRKASYHGSGVDAVEDFRGA